MSILSRPTNINEPLLVDRRYQIWAAVVSFGLDQPVCLLNSWMCTFLWMGLIMPLCLVLIIKDRHCQWKIRGVVDSLINPIIVSRIDSKQLTIGAGFWSLDWRQTSSIICSTVIALGLHFIVYIMWAFVRIRSLDCLIVLCFHEH